MARSRSISDAIARVLDHSGLPLFLLDDQRQIVCWNAATADWTAMPSAAMLDQRCDYHAPDAQTDAGPATPAGRSDASAVAAALAAALCPPPQVFNGLRQRVLRSAINGSGQIIRRWIDYLPLSDGSDGSAPVLAIVDALDATADSPLDRAAPVEHSPLDATAEQLHQQLIEFRRRCARRYVADQFVGNDASIVRARAQAALAAHSGTSVLIIGPRGSGRQHLARSIHYARHPQGDAALLPVACASLGSELLAATIRPLVERSSAAAPDADSSGTLLLVDVDQLPAEVQGPLAQRLAGGKLPAQLIATTLLPVDEIKSTGILRPDLLGQLGTVVIELPPLVDHLADLPLISQALIESINGEGGKQLAGFTPEALDLMAGYAWPENLDELTRVVAEAHAQAAGPEITPRDLPKRLLLAADAAAYPRRDVETIVLEDFLAGIERELIERALAEAKGNKSRAARLLGLTRPRLYRRMVQIGLAPPGEDVEDASS